MSEVAEEQTDVIEEVKAEPKPEPDVAPEVEAEARRMGWRPEDEWEGDTDNHLSAPKFVERQERWRKRADTVLQTRLDKQSKEIGDLKTTIENLGSHLTKATENAYKKALKDLEAKADKAVEDGDTEEYKRIRGETKALEEEVKTEAKTEKKKSDPVPEDDPEYMGWMSDNAWYDPNSDGFDVEASAYADSIVEQVGRRGLKNKALYDAVAGEVKKKFPEKFGNARRRNAAAVEGAGSSRRSNGKGYADLPSDAKAICDRFVSQKVWHDIESGENYARKARERYCQEYFEE